MADEVNEKPEECEGCEFATTNLTFYPARLCGDDATIFERAAWLCELCEGTSSGSAATATRRNEHVDVHLITATICYVGNKILEELRRG
jgi:hypothetical protein